MKFVSALAAFLLTAPLVVTAGPFPSIPRALPDGTARLAFDDAARRLIAYDSSGKELGKFNPSSLNPQKRAAGSCVDLSSEELQKLPGWKALEEAGNKNWGTGKRNIVTNDKDFLDSPAKVCVDDNSMTLEKNGNAKCNTVEQTITGHLTNTNGSVTLTTTTGTTYASSNTVTKQSSLATDVTVSVKFSILGVFDIGVSTSTTTSFKNTLSDETSVIIDSTSQAPLTQNVPPGKTCHLEFKSKDCTVEGKGKVRFTATGWVWFEYDDKVQGHYKWALSIDNTVPNVNDRSSFAEFRAAISSNTKSDYKSICA